MFFRVRTRLFNAKDEISVSALLLGSWDVETKSDPSLTEKSEKVFTGFRENWVSLLTISPRLQEERKNGKELKIALWRPGTCSVH